jgi:AraC-like DNA-binding protein
MRNDRQTSNERDSQHELAVGGALLRRKSSFSPDGAYLFEDALEIKGVLTAKVITCAAWLLELYELTAGELSFIRGEEQVRTALQRIGVLYPPFTISQPHFENVKGRLAGVAATAPLPTQYRAVPLMFETTDTEPPGSLRRALEILNSGVQPRPVEMNPAPSLLSLRAKRLLDENYLDHPSIARVAGRLGVAHAHLSRQFKRDFGMSPSNYLHQLRLADAPLRLARGEEIINVSQEVGYNDLSRFYKQFRKSNRTSPGACQSLMRPHGKEPDRA